MSSSDTPKDLILGTATGAAFLRGALPFAVSARRQHPTADIVLLTDPQVPADLGREMARLGVRLWPVQTHAVDADFHIQNRRFREYFRFLLEADYRLVFLSDTRDVYFQDNLFSAFTSAGEWIAFFEETARFTIGSEKFNRNWILSIFGENALRALEREIVICSGTTLGTRRAILEYLALMATLEETHRTMRAIPSDQGQHNYLVRKRLMHAPQLIFPQENSLVYTVHTDDKYTITASGQVLTPTGVRPAAVHQYDRTRDIERVFLNEVRQHLASVGLTVADQVTT